MGAKIIPFPAKSEPNLPEIEKVIRGWLFNISEEPEFIDTVAGRMMSFINNYTNKWFEPVFDVMVPPAFTPEEKKTLVAAIEAGVDKTAREVQEMINRIIIERFFLEVEIYEGRQKGTHIRQNGK